MMNTAEYEMLDCDANREKRASSAAVHGDLSTEGSRCSDQRYSHSDRPDNVSIATGGAAEE
jgi:hypothetical protein